MDNEIFAKYLGDGSAYVEGIPARDLTRDEWERIRPDLRELAVATGLYAVPPAKSEKPARGDKSAARTEV